MLRELTPDDAPERAREATLSERTRTWMSQLYPLDALLFGLFVLDRVAVGPVPGGVVLTLVIGLLGFYRAPKLRMSGLPVLAGCYAALLVYLAVVSQDAGVDWQQRAIRFAILAILVWVLVQGRFDAYSAVVGICVGLLVNAAAYYAGLTTDAYPPFLTGWLGDKNVAGMWYATFGILGLVIWSRRKWAVLWVLAIGTLLFLTGSRTSMSGFAAAMVWFGLRNRLVLPLRLALAGGLIAVLIFAEENLARIGIFSDRSGTDSYRERVDAATALKLEQTPWQGRGLTEAWVWLTDVNRQWFHDSYAALYVEGGVVLLGFILVVWVLVAGGLLSPRTVSRGAVATEAALVAVLVCAWKLGEVFFTSCAFIALALALRARYSTPVAPQTPEGAAIEPTAFSLEPAPGRRGEQ